MLDLLEGVPKPLAVVFGSQLGWSPRCEAQRPGSCTTCGGVPEGSRLFCAACCSTGFDTRLAQLRARDPVPKARPAPKHRPKLNARDRKALVRTPEGREFLRQLGYDAEEPSGTKS